MDRKTNRKRSVRAAAVVVAGLVGVSTLAGGAAAQPAGGSGEPPLRGPTVRERNVPGAGQGFTMEGERRGAGERIPMPVFMRAVRSLAEPDAPAGVRAEPEQMEVVRALVDQFEADRRAYLLKNREELRRLRGEAGQRRGAERGEGRGEAGGEGMRGGEPGAAAQRLRELEQGAPKPEELYTKIWEELTEEQRGHVDAQLDVFRAERAREREEAYVRQRVPEERRQGRGAGGMMEEEGPGMRPPPPRAAPGEPGQRRPMDGARGRGGADPELVARRDRLLRTFEQLSPEEQDRIITRLEMMLREREGRGEPMERPGAGEGREPRRPGRRPPPGMDEVNVPEPGGRPEEGGRRPRPPRSE